MMWRLMVLLGVGWMAGSASAATIMADSCSRADVNTAVSSAASGDTVRVPAGACTWDTYVQITKGITLQGAGAGVTVITSNLADQTKGLIHYAPDAMARSLDVLFRVTGFTIDLAAKDNGAHGIYLYNDTATPVTNTRIDHNTIQNSLGGSGTKRGVYVRGAVYGVVDNNTFLQCNQCVDGEGTNSTTQWLYLPVAFGTAANIYVEDNLFINTDAPYSPAFMAGGQGGRYAARYNQFTIAGTALNVAPAFDVHGNQWSSYGMMVNEFYGNLWSFKLANNSNYIIDQRGSRLLVFFNRLDTHTGTTGHYFRVREEYADADENAPPGNPGTFLMHAVDSYYFGNRHVTNGSGALISASIGASDECCEADAGYGSNPLCCYNVGGTKGIRMNTDVFTEPVSFDGSAGVGCGPLAARPATCTIGVGYWATTQSCGDLTGLVGPHPATPIAGTLYKCTDTNTWTDYYTPFPYPHPLRGEKATIKVRRRTGEDE